MELTAIFIVGFIVLGIYKLFELFVRKSERLALIEKLPAFLNTDEQGGKINFPEISFLKKNQGSWPLRIALLFMGVGLGCLLAFFIQYNVIDYIERRISDLATNQELMHIRFVLYFSFIAICGGLSLLGAYFIEKRQAKK